jgi:hypothetical protein
MTLLALIARADSVEFLRQVSAKLARCTGVKAVLKFCVTTVAFFPWMISQADKVNCRRSARAVTAIIEERWGDYGQLASKFFRGSKNRREQSLDCARGQLFVFCPVVA